MPERDQDTGRQVGTQSRARSILSSPLTVGIVGAGTLLGVEALLPAAATSAAAAPESGAVAAVAAPEAGTAAVAPVVEGTAVAPAAPAAAVDSTVVVADDTSLAANAARGAESQARVLKDMGLTRNTSKVTTKEGRAVSDALTAETSVEIKDMAYVVRTKQLRIQTRAAEASGRKSVLVTGDKTRISKQAKKAFDIIVRRSDLGPR